MEDEKCDMHDSRPIMVMRKGVVVKLSTTGSFSVRVDRNYAYVADKNERGPMSTANGILTEAALTEPSQSNQFRLINWLHVGNRSILLSIEVVTHDYLRVESCVLSNQSVIIEFFSGRV
jgi:hypothetical protein